MRLEVAMVGVAALSACATIPSGHGGVLLGASGVARDPLAEGAYFVGPLAAVELYDLRAQEQNEDLDALSADGAKLEARASVLTFHPALGELVALAREVGPDYYRIVVRPVVRSTLRRVLAALRADELDTPGITRVEREVTALTAGRLRSHHIVFDAISLRTLGIAPSSAGYRATLETGVKEQEALAARQLPELARQQREERRAEARGIARSHALIAPTITPELLLDSENRAWARLLAAPSTHIEVHATAQPCILEVQP
jgi:regulator of protease activity HflC (stomatin/prohibitin superfamily)